MMIMMGEQESLLRSEEEEEDESESFEHIGIEEAPPSYDSLYGRIKRAHEEEDALGFMQSSFNIMGPTVGCIMLLDVLLVIPIAAIVIGSQKLNECPIEPFIPLFLIIFGAVSIVLIVIEIYNQSQKRVQGDKYKRGQGKTIVEGVLCIILLVWFLAGIIWVYLTYPVDNMDTSSDLYCDKKVYLFAVGLLVAGMIFACLILVYCSCSYCITCLRQSKCPKGSSSSRERSSNSSRNTDIFGPHISGWFQRSKLAGCADCAHYCGEFYYYAAAAVGIALILAVPISSIAIGLRNFHDCPKERYIPIYLIVSGSSTVLVVLISISQLLRKKDERYENTSYTASTCFLGIMSCFMIAWFIAGNVWVYKNYKPDFEDKASTEYCDKTLYLFSFGLITFVYAILCVMLLCMCCALTCCFTCCGTLREKLQESFPF